MSQMGRAASVCLIALLGLVVAGFCDVAKYTGRARRRDTRVGLAGKKDTSRYSTVRDSRPAAQLRHNARRDDDEEYECDYQLSSYAQCGEYEKWSDVCCPYGWECVSSGEGSNYMQCRPYESSGGDYEVEWWRQCGGKSPPGDLEGVEPVDDAYPDYYCKSGSECERVDAHYWQCVPYETYDRTKDTGAGHDSYRNDARSGLTSRKDSGLGLARRKDTRAGVARKDNHASSTGTGKDSHSLTARKDSHPTIARRQDSHSAVGSRKDAHLAVRRKDTGLGLAGRKDIFSGSSVKDTHSAARRDDDNEEYECEYQLSSYAQCGEYEKWSDVCCPYGWECVSSGEGSNYMQCRPYESSGGDYEVDWWRQCGGKSPPGDLEGVEPVDDAYPDYYCKLGSECERVDAHYWQCVPYETYDRTKAGRDSYHKDAGFGLASRKDSHSIVARKDGHSTAATHKDSHSTAATHKDSHSIAATHKDSHSTAATHKLSHSTIGARMDAHALTGAGKDSHSLSGTRKDVHLPMASHKDARSDKEEKEKEEEEKHEHDDEHYEIEWYHQCGGLSLGEIKDVEPVDGEYPDYFCREGSYCKRFDSWYWQCTIKEGEDRHDARHTTGRKDARQTGRTDRTKHHKDLYWG